METRDFVIETYVMVYRDKHGREQELYFPRVPDNAKGEVSYPWPGERRTTYKHEGECLALSEAVAVMRDALGYK